MNKDNTFSRLKLKIQMAAYNGNPNLMSQSAISILKILIWKLKK